MSIGAILGGAGSILGAGISYLTARQNRKSQESQNLTDRMYNWERYSAERRDALSDWERQNAYNHPAQQMIRLREAGLNPHMMYGGGAQMTGSIVRSSQGGNHTAPAPKMNEGILPQMINDIFANINAVYEARRKDAETDNLRVQNTVLQQEALLKGAQRSATSAQSDLYTQEYGQRGRMNDLDYRKGKNELALQRLDMAKKQAETTLIELGIPKAIAETKNIVASTKYLEAQTKRTLTENEIAQLMKAPNLRLAFAEIALKQEQTLNVSQEARLNLERVSTQEQETALKEAEAKLLAEGISKSDPYYYRLLYQIWIKLLTQ